MQYGLSLSIESSVNYLDFSESWTRPLLYYIVLKTIQTWQHVKISTTIIIYNVWKIVIEKKKPMGTGGSWVRTKHPRGSSGAYGCVLQNDWGI